MIRRPPRSTRTDTLFPYTTLFRSRRQCQRLTIAHRTRTHCRTQTKVKLKGLPKTEAIFAIDQSAAKLPLLQLTVTRAARSEERRVGKECVSTCRARWSPYHYKKKPIYNTRIIHMTNRTKPPNKQ